MSAGPLLFGTNWKMHKTTCEAKKYAEQLRLRILGLNHRVKIFVIPPYTSLSTVRAAADGVFWVGAQNMHWAESGPYTGEISAPMLKELGVDLVEIGHAERRQFFNESDASVNQKVHTALRFKLRPLVCIGEDANDRSYEVEQETVSRQLRIALHGVSPGDSTQLIIAYEPAWAIGENGTVAPPEYVARMTAVCRKVLSSMFGTQNAPKIPILYGGSINERDAPTLLAGTGINGLFVGRAAAEPDSFADLVHTCVRAVPIRAPNNK